MTMSLPRRIYWGKAVLYLVSFLMVCTITWKSLKVKSMIEKTSDHDEFKSEIRFYESLGYVLDYPEEMFDGTPNSDGNYIFAPDMTQSFLFEAFLAFLIALTYEQYHRLGKKIRLLTNEKTIKDLDILTTYYDRL